ncbi:PIG-L deacetylase family protein [Streptomyces rimosus]|uniref:PIG-L deacetylase family protein n=1 Tax=Streptomyces rimosus TaxID=1927 RepID=UPI0004C4EE09|nr:PIG-L family deacetylase [Streptomyces rimosus]
MTPPPPRTVILSPHFDDAALSLAGLIPRLPAPVTVVTVFGGAPAAQHAVSWWDSTCGFSTAAEAHRARLAEDARAADLLGVDQAVLDHPDGPYGTGDELTGIDAYLSALPTPFPLVLLPIGTNQPDHTRVRDRALRVLDGLGAPLPLLYADLPYTGHLPEWGTPDTDRALGDDPTYGLSYQDLLTRYDLDVAHDLVLDDAEWARKREAVLCYGSQLAPLAADHGSVLARRGPLRAERVWSTVRRPQPAGADA